MYRSVKCTHILLSMVSAEGVLPGKKVWDSRHSCWHNGGFLPNITLLCIITLWVYCRLVKYNMIHVLVILKKNTDNVQLIILQYTGWYDDSTVGGIEGSISKMIAADPTFGEFN